ncbi:MAG: UbiA-like protein EboC [Flammeovirgaceae bacterium]|jgi:4-hydroxybenzoate polyprenyltransferase|nr:UbiA-like protein EboC [Flammeovirgaceae bacterium]|tara:strand:- start:10721 stop:11611 length:891 start_codon:yes stop_codon:yes gene_type:complete
MRMFPYLVLIRPANVITAITDIIAGSAITGFLLTIPTYDQSLSFIYLIVSTIGLYGGGIVLNDVFDQKIDSIERPERPIPSGQISIQKATMFALALFSLGIVFAFFAHPVSGLIAILIAISAAIYDKYSKHHAVFGPLNMGICRGLNLILGMSILVSNPSELLLLMALIPVLFVAAITLTSQGEVFGNNKSAIVLALSLDLVIFAILLILGMNEIMSLRMSLAFIFIWIGMNFWAKMLAISVNKPIMIKRAVKMGVISIIPLNATYVAGFSHWQLGIVVLLLLPISILAARKFAVT